MAKILLGVSGGIAAYKAPETARALVRGGHEVHAVLTEAAQRLVAPAALAAVTGRRVYLSMWEGVEDGRMDHIGLAAEADAVVVAPATADLLARAAAGRAADLLSASLLVTRAPVLLAPAMNTNMWEHPFTRRNVAALAALPNVHWVGPERGELACGREGMGRMSDPAEIARELERILGRRHDLEGISILVTAGPTWEPIDPVRFVGNRSSGRMGQAIAEAAAERGAKTVLVRGPTALPPPAKGVVLVEVVTAAEMRKAVLARWRKVDAVVMAAAVSDYRPSVIAGAKIKRTAAELKLDLAVNPDILAEMGRLRGSARRPALIGFCVETGAADLSRAARAKLVAKRCDAVVANLAQDSLGGETGRIEIHRRSGRPDGPLEGTKTALAREILDRLVVPILSTPRKGRPSRSRHEADR